ncbi:MAG: PEP-CTERM sorting domain-containing protein [Planctomycetota bacterium]|nr:PEP-CTERM sorting domain-containing protein [Planctomycetota bacterium]
MISISKQSLVLGAAWTLLSLSTVAARAEYVAPARDLPSPGHTTLTLVSYATPGGLYQIDSFFDVFTELQQVPPPGPGATSIDSFFDVFTEISLSTPGGPFQVRESPTRHSQMRTTNSGPTPAGDGTVFDTEMLSLDLSGGTMPPGLMIRESPTLPSTGKTTIRESPSLPGMYQIDSFFDVFTELSFDGGQTWTPGDQPMHLTGVPEPSSIVLAMVGFAALGWCGFRRRNH